jgi:apolipoprotein N-acyltransferase
LSAVLALPNRLPAALKGARGIRRLAIAAGLGAVGALAFEPFGLFPFLLLSYAGLVLLLDGANTCPRRFRDAAITGWAFGFGFFLLSHYWIGYAFLVDAEAHAWLMPFAMVLLPAGLALFFAAAAAFCMVAWHPGVSRVFLFALAFMIAEWLRGHILTGFPWNLPGYGWSASTAVLQSTSLLGIYGLSLLTLLLGASFALLASENGSRAKLLPAIVSVVFLTLWAGGEMRLESATNATVTGVRLRLVQPSTPQPEKYAPENTVRNWRRLMDLSALPAAQQPTHIIWPEAAPPFVLERVPQALAEIAALTAESRVLMTGQVRIADEGGRRASYNSFAIFGPDGQLLGTYDKFHLVPFGEYVPVGPVLRTLGITEIAADTGFSSGPGPRTMIVPGAPPVGPLICYEIIFPREVTGAPRPGWLVNLTDDSWFGPDTGPRQHLLIARVRAIEEGLPVVRAANSGISAVIDAHGRVRASLALGLRDVVDSDLPVALSPTLFVRYGNVILLMLLLISAAAALLPLRPRHT